MGKEFTGLNKSFLTHLGRHGIENFTGKIGIGDLAKIAQKKSITSADFKEGAKALLNASNVSDMGIRVGAHLTGCMIEGGFNALANRTKQKVPMLSTSSNQSLGCEKASIRETTVHIGTSTSSRVKRMQNNTSVEYEEKVLASSSKDYQSASKRKNLSLNTGFNRKGFCFLMEDTYMSVKDYLSLYDAKMIEKALNKGSGKGVKNLYSCSYKTKTELSILNQFTAYNVAIKLHLVKITDLDCGVRDLIKAVTNNKT